MPIMKADALRMTASIREARNVRFGLPQARIQADVQRAGQFAQSQTARQQLGFQKSQARGRRQLIQPLFQQATEAFGQFGQGGGLQGPTAEEAFSPGIKRSFADIRDQLASSFASRGVFGGGRADAAIGDLDARLQESLMGLQFQDVDRRRQQQLQMGQLAAQLGGQL